MSLARLAVAAGIAAAALALWWFLHEPSRGIADPPVAPATADAAPAGVTPASPAADPALASGPGAEVTLGEQRSGVKLPRRVLRNTISAPSGSVAETLRALLPLAEQGDQRATYQLSQALAKCVRVEQDEAELEANVLKLQQTRLLDDLPVENVPAMEAELRRRFEMCRGVTAEERGAYHALLTHAADAGLLDALENYGFTIPPGDICMQREFESCTAAQQANSVAARDKVVGYLQQAREAGSGNSLWQLGAAYLNGELLPADSIQAYAHLRAYQDVLHAFERDDRVARLIEDLRGRLRPVELELGEERARELLANPRCCVLYR